MKRAFAVLAVTLCQASFGGDLGWYETKAVDANQQGSQVVSFYGKIDTDDIKAITLGTAPPAFVLISSLMSVDQSGVVKKVEDMTWNGKHFSSGSIYIKSENILTIIPLHKKITAEFEKVGAK